MIVSLTSYPKRINCCTKVLKSLVQQLTSEPVKIVLCLCTEEFPNKEKDLPQEIQEYALSGCIEIIWCEKNIKSHKKLMCTLKKYPDEDILITDDDIIRPQGWIQTFIDDHKKHPNDIMCGLFMYTLDYTFTWKRLSGINGEKCKAFNNIPDLKFDCCRPANGAGGVLYPAHTFTDPRFFNEELMMKICPTSDETWQFAFNIIENRNFRQTSKVYDASATLVENSQQCGLYRINNYDMIFQNVTDAFPEIINKIITRRTNIIVSLTSYHDRILSKSLDMSIESILKQTLQPKKIVLTLYKKDIPLLSSYIKGLIDDNTIELISVDDDIMSHKKYFYAMQKYKECPIVLMDDDIVYDENTIMELYKSYTKHPNCVNALRTHRIKRDNKGVILPYSKWDYECKNVNEPDIELFATTGYGTLYPPDILKINDSVLKQYNICKTCDDVLLHFLQRQRDIKTVFCGHNIKHYYIKNKKNLYIVNVHHENDKAIRLLYD